MVEGGQVRPEDAEQDPWPGRALAEQVEVRELIGVGAMGRVYLGHQRGVERPVAVKVLHADLMHNPAVLARFHREARVASRLNHPNVVQVLMTGEVTLSARGDGVESGDAHAPPENAAYLVMEYLDGASLAAVLESQSEPLSLGRALHIVLQVCDAVGEAHDQGIVHRDLKPENVMLVRRGGDPDFVKVLDFGVAKLDWLDGAQATQAGSVFGTARYISPEGAYGEEVTPRSDVYSIATLLYQCLTGRTPFDGNNTVAVLVKQRAEPAPDLRGLNANIPEPIARVVHQNLAKAPGDRVATARDLGAALLAAAREARVDSEALAHRPTLHGTRPSVPTPVPEVQAKPREVTLIDPDLAQIPVGGAPRPANRPWTEIGPISSPERAVRHTADGTRPALEAPLDAPIPSRRGRRLSRGARWALGLAGVAVAGGLLLARGIKNTNTSANGLQAELDRANAALAVGSWHTDDKRGFVDVTDAALARFPDSEELVELRLRGARRLAREARKAEDLNPQRANELAAFATRLAPHDTGVAELIAPLLTEQAVAVVAHAPEQPASQQQEGPSAPQSTSASPAAPAAEVMDRKQAPTQGARTPSAPVSSAPDPTSSEEPSDAKSPDPDPNEGLESSPDSPPSEEPPLDEPRSPGGRWL
jgi:serine/threonine protein kinase